MKKYYSKYLAIVLAALLFSCSSKIDVSENYQVVYINGWTLQYDLGDNCGIGRVMNVDKVGIYQHYIFATSNGEYFWFDERMDIIDYNHDEIVIGPMSQTKFVRTLDSLKITIDQFEILFEK